MSTKRRRKPVDEAAVIVGSPDWVHPFQRAGHGTAPFRCTGYTKSVFHAVPDEPPRPGSSCDYCGTCIMHVYTIRGSGPNDVPFKVGCDCVARTNDTALSAALEAARREAEREYRRRAWEAAAPQREAAEREREARRLARAERNAEEFAMVLAGAALAADSPNVGDYARAICARLYEDLTEGERDYLTDEEERHLPLSYLAAVLPPSMHIGKPGERLRGLRARYEGGPTIGEFGPWPSVLGKFRVLEGPHAGAVLLWKTGGHPCMRGSVVDVTGTVLAEEPHVEYKGQLETRVTRCKVEVIDYHAIW